jgi:sugar phosphate isomerase/epimerase
VADAPRPRVGVSCVADDADVLVRTVARAADWARVVELPSDYPLHALPARALRELRAVADANGTGYAVHAPMLGVDLGALLPGLHRAAVAECRRALRFAAAIGADVVTIHPAFAPPTASARRHADRIIENERRSLVALVAAARADGLTLALENMPRIGAFREGSADLSDILRTLDAVPDPCFGATLDVGHSHQAGLDPCQAVVALGGRLRQVHASDNDGTADDHLPIGQGTVDWPAFAGAVVARGYAGAVVIEPNPGWTEAEMRRSVAVLDDLLGAACRAADARG